MGCENLDVGDKGRFYGGGLTVVLSIIGWEVRRSTYDGDCVPVGVAAARFAKMPTRATRAFWKSMVDFVDVNYLVVL